MFEDLNEFEVLMHERSRALEKDLEISRKLKASRIKNDIKDKMDNLLFLLLAFRNN